MFIFQLQVNVQVPLVIYQHSLSMAHVWEVPRKEEDKGKSIKSPNKPVIQKRRAHDSKKIKCQQQVDPLLAR